MATLQSNKANSGRNPPKVTPRRRKKPASRLKAASPVAGDGQAGTRRTAPVDGPLRKFLRAEQEVLIKTQSLIVCVTKAMKPGHGPGEPYYPDILELAAKLLRQRVVNLDELLLWESCRPARAAVPQTAIKWRAEHGYSAFEGKIGWKALAKSPLVKATVCEEA
jgi:hypothetical protein